MMETILYSLCFKWALVWTLLLLSAVPHAALVSIILIWLDSKHVLTRLRVAIATILEVLLPQSFHHKTISTFHIIVLEMVPSCPPIHDLVGNALPMPRWVTSDSLFSRQSTNICFRNHFTHVHSCSSLLELHYKGTGSPTSPGATNAPISPSPTGSITSAPTPTAITTFHEIGGGYVS